MHTINIPYFFWELIYSDILFQNTFYHQNNETFEYKLETIVDCVRKQYLTK